MRVVSKKVNEGHESLNLRMHANYRRAIEKAQQSHERNRNPAGINSDDIALARLYCYAFRLHIIGAFHATRVALDACRPSDQLATAFRQRATETLEDLASQSMEPVAQDFQVVVTALYRYHRGVLRVLDSLEADWRHSSDQQIKQIAERFRRMMEEITGDCGIHVTQDTHEPEQGSFVVPGLGISIVPLVYGDHHSWNLAWLAGEERNVPTHKHYQGVEIHLGYEPSHGITVLGDCKAQVDAGYAMPIPPNTRHGWVNTSDAIHHVPFIFGSLQHAGWGVFLDVQPSTRSVDELTLVPRDSPQFSQMVYLEREIQQAANMSSTHRRTLIPFTVTNRDRSGGLELSLTRVKAVGYAFQADLFRAVSVARGEGEVSIAGVERIVRAHDHFGVPAGMICRVRQSGDEPLVLLDAMIKGFTSR